MPVLLIKHDEDPADKIFLEAGNLDEIEVFNNQVLVGIYLRPNKMMLGGKEFYTTDKTIDEDRYQSKVGLILKKGPVAFEKKDETSIWFKDQMMNVGDWVVFRPSNGWNTTLVSIGKDGRKQELACKMLSDTDVMARVSGPMAADRIY